MSSTLKKRIMIEHWSEDKAKRELKSAKILIEKLK